MHQQILRPALKGDGDGTGAAQRLNRIGKDVQKHLVELSGIAINGRVVLILFNDSDRIIPLRF